MDLGRFLVCAAFLIFVGANAHAGAPSPPIQPAQVSPSPPQPSQPSQPQPSQAKQPYAPYLPPLATLIAAFLGPWFAFRVATRGKRREEREKRILAGNLAIHVLSLQYTALMNIKEQIVDPARSQPVRYLVMQPTLPSSSQNLEIDYRDLDFLLNGKNPIVLYDLRISQTMFKDTLQAFNEWSRIHREEAQPRLESAGVRYGGSYTQSQIESSLGPRITGALRSGAENSIEMFDRTTVKLTEMSKALHQALKEFFPGEKFLTFEKKNA